MKHCTSREEFEAVKADYYGHPEQEQYHHESVADFLVEQEPEPPVTIVAMADIDPPSEEDLNAHARYAIEYIEEHFEDEYGDPQEAVAFDSVRSETWDALQAAIIAYLQEGRIGRVEEVARYTYTADEVRAILEAK